MSLILKPDPTDKTPNRFIVLFDGAQVGRIFESRARRIRTAQRYRVLEH